MAIHAGAWAAQPPAGPLPGAPLDTLGAPTLAAQAAADAIGRMMALHDPEVGRHHARVAALAAALAHALGVPQGEREGIRLAAALHDIGKIAVPLGVVNKAAPLNMQEMQQLQGHPQAGEHILENVPFGAAVATMIRQHHERLDGSGYPDGLSGDEIPRGTRIVAVADVLDSMVTDRPYRPAPGLAAAEAELRRGSGILYDAAVVEACLSLCRDQTVLRILAAGAPAPSLRPDQGQPAGPPADVPRLTLQQTAVMHLLAEGRSTKEIARTLGLGLGTVKTHLSRAYATLGAGNRVAALRAAGLLEPGGR